jgi:hypothetical protein
MIVVVEVIPYHSFKERIRITRTAKGKVTVEKDYIMVERVEVDL